MSDLVDDLAARGRSLPPDQRVRLLDLLLASLQEPSLSVEEAALAAEIERRVALHERGEGKLHDMDEVLAEARRLAP